MKNLTLFGKYYSIIDSTRGYYNLITISGLNLDFD